MNYTQPQRTHSYHGHHFIDGRRWDRFAPRSGDIVISTSYKAGTTWVQVIVANLLFQDGKLPAPVINLSPWFDLRLTPVEETLADLEAQRHRRFIKTHLPLNGLRFFDQIKYLVVGRDARDVFMSMVNHHTNYTASRLAKLREFDDDVGQSFPYELGGAKTMWRQWMTRSWFEWETDGYPYWSHLGHVQSWWNYRHLGNVLLIHFADLLRDTPAEIRRIARYLDIAIDESHWHGILERVSFDSMRRNFDHIIPGADQIWRGGGETFMNKGTNGRWKTLLDERDLEYYRVATERTMTPDARVWMEQGGAIPPDPV